MSDAKAVLEGLTEAQKRAIANARWIHPGGMDPICLVDFTDPWAAPIAQFFTMMTDRLTPLGLSVRALIEEQKV